MKKWEASLLATQRVLPSELIAIPCGDRAPTDTSPVTVMVAASMTLITVELEPIIPMAGMGMNRET